MAEIPRRIAGEDRSEKVDGIDCRPRHGTMEIAGQDKFDQKRNQVRFLLN